MLAQDLSTNKGALISANRPVDEKMNESKKKKTCTFSFYTQHCIYPLLYYCYYYYYLKKKIVHVLLVI